MSEDRDDLGARVVAARGRSVVDPPPEAGLRLGRLTWGTVAICVVGAVVFLVVLRRSSDLGAASGTATARERTEVDLGHRGTAVLEPGAAIDWRVDRSGDLHVLQRAGAVFYNHPHGRRVIVSGGFGLLEAERASFTVRAGDPASLTVHQGRVSRVCGDRESAVEVGPPRSLPPCAAGD